jgi:hypothetical protein
MTPEEYYRGKLNVQKAYVPPVYVPPQQDTAPYEAPHFVFPAINQNTGLIILGVVAIVGLLGLFAVLGTKERKCER